MRMVLHLKDDKQNRADIRRILMVVRNGKSMATEVLHILFTIFFTERRHQTVNIQKLIRIILQRAVKRYCSFL